MGGGALWCQAALVCPAVRVLLITPLSNICRPGNRGKRASHGGLTHNHNMLRNHLMERDNKAWLRRR